MQIKILAIRPGISPIVRCRGKNLPVFKNPLTVKHRLHEPALPAVPLPRAGQQPPPEHQRERLHHCLAGTEATTDNASGECPARPDEDVRDNRRVRHEVKRHRPRGDPRDRAVRPMQMSEARERIGA